MNTIGPPRSRAKLVPFWKTLLVAMTMSFTLTAFILRELDFGKQIVCPYCDVQNEKTQMDISQLTFITYANPDQSINSEFKNAIHSWLNVSKEAKVLILRSNNRLDATFTFLSSFPKDRVQLAWTRRIDMKRHIYLDDYFEIGTKLITSKYAVFIRPSVFIQSQWFSAVQKAIQDVNTSKYVIVGQTYLKSLNKVYDYTDFFLFQVTDMPFDIYSIPPFISSKEYWPEWLLGWFNHQTTLFSLDKSYLVSSRQLNDVFNLNNAMTAVNKNVAFTNGNFSANIRDVAYMATDSGIISMKKTL
ncbi:hypothetical protein TVAG_292820 [Trichomonas vaginalis G3]|uniref:Uncharacterized protein n=1 Tax=Trichomonas vaginalis (strain ATCC PRA-98 / G3) TaxID=412133 RepID=A2EWX2_TRIV3|nr:hypothetical protein TVAGG3_0268050 [Trichomonas vaginalis G3]EAY02814.1 hypothetical protein TVAG_292820 [Trichomonas vaginalis G3]KAI5525650.1 hypothetical protein TVAGG3_0268050 [Trichomonas vaginalis G3]|eukprot:XP_001315037.1 hypothetical protein [Trichomonas vaginalis G3]